MLQSKHKCQWRSSVSFWTISWAYWSHTPNLTNQWKPSRHQIHTFSVYTLTRLTQPLKLSQSRRQINECLLWGCISPATADISRFWSLIRKSSKMTQWIFHLLLNWICLPCLCTWCVISLRLKLACKQWWQKTNVRQMSIDLMENESNPIQHWS